MSGKIDLPTLHRGLEQAYGLDAVWFSDHSRSSGIHLLMPKGLLVGIGWVEGSKHEIYSPDGHILTHYPTEPRNLNHKMHLKQISETEARLLEIDQYDYMEGASDFPLVLCSQELSGEALTAKVIEYSLGCYVLGTAIGDEMLRTQNTRNLTETEQYGQDIISRGDYLGYIDASLIVALEEV